MYFQYSLQKADIYEEVSMSIRPLGLDCECLGGGRIEHKPNEKRIKVYGYSQVRIFIDNLTTFITINSILYRVMVKLIMKRPKKSC